MSCYVSSNNNRLYVALESTFGTVPGITGQNRIPGVKLVARQVPEPISRRDKTGSRTFPGLPNAIRKSTSYLLSTFMTQWTNHAADPTMGPLVQAGMGAPPIYFNGGTVAAAVGTSGLSSGITFAAPHGLAVGQAVTHETEMRFVSGIQDATTVFFGAPFTNVHVGDAFGRTATYRLANDIGSASIFDYWDPSTAVQRILEGAVVDTLRIKVNGDFQEFAFGGAARELLDSTSFASGQGGLATFPTEPTSANFDYTVIPGHLGQVWMGATPTQFFTLTGAELTLHNDVQLRVREFGSDLARCVAAGKRNVKLNFSLFEQDDAQTKGLYQAARQRSPIGVLIQLGQQSGQLFGAYMPAMVPEVPAFDDQETRLQWKFQNDRAQGTVNDEFYVAFG
jgi:hypothetical protein